MAGDGVNDAPALADGLGGSDGAVVGQCGLQCPAAQPETLVNISSAARASAVSERMIRHYEKIGLVPPPHRRDSGYRDYSEADIHRLRFIANARDLGFGINAIGMLLALWSDRQRASSEVKAMALARADELARKVQALENMRRTLFQLAEQCHGDDRPDCPILDRLKD